MLRSLRFLNFGKSMINCKKIEIFKNKYFYSTTNNNNNNNNLLIFNSKLSKFNDVHVYSKDIKTIVSNNSNRESDLDDALKNSLVKWKNEKRSSAWLHVPLEHSELIKISHKYGFIYHHAENDLAVLFKWLADNRVCSIPRYATHQVGSAGCVYNKDTDEILVVKDKHSLTSVFKFPGGAADLGENIGKAAVREVFEETGIKSKFCSLLAFRQVHDYPGAYGRSDFYFISRLEPLTFSIKACDTEIVACEWHTLDRLVNYKENKLVQRVAKLISFAKLNDYNFDLIDINKSQLTTVSGDRTYNFYHKSIPLN